MYLYIFGSACRGELDENSDIDMLAIHDEKEKTYHLDGNKISIYSERKIKEIWDMGNPFAWHLHYESKLIYSPNDIDFLKNLGTPSAYKEGLTDCIKFYNILEKSTYSVRNDKYSLVFDFSTIFLCIRNISTCYSLHFNKPNFSRDSAILLGQNSLTIDLEIYNSLKNCRLANTRGRDIFLTDLEINLLLKELEYIQVWAKRLIELIKNDFL